MKIIILLIFWIPLTFAEVISGLGLSKVDAFKDAYLKFSLKYGNIESSQRLVDDIGLLNNISIKSFKFVPEITLIKCRHINTQSSCLFNFTKARKRRSPLKDLDIPICSKGVNLCHYLKEQGLISHGQLSIIKGIIEVVYYRYGINLKVIRHREKHIVHGVGQSEQMARKSLKLQGELVLKKRRNAKEVIDLVYRESLYDMYVKAHDEGDLKSFIKEGLYPVEVISKGRNIIFFVKKIRGSSLLD